MAGRKVKSDTLQAEKAVFSVFIGDQVISVEASTTAEAVRKAEEQLQ